MQINEIFSTKRQAIDKAKSTVFAAMVIASIVVSFSIVTINFLWDLRSYNARVISEKEQARDTLNQNIESIEQLKEQFVTFEQGEITSQQILDALPSKYDYAAVVTSLDSLAKRSGMLLTAFAGDDLSAEAQQTTISPEPVAIPFTIDVEGSYEDLQEFLEVLHRSIRPMSVESIEITGNDNSIIAEITMSTFYQPEASLEVETKEVQ